MKKNIIKGSVFLILLVATIFITFLIIPKTDSKEERTLGYRLKENSNLDVGVMGNSDLYAGFIPALFYKETGLTSYNSGKSKVNINQEYDYVSDYFKYQKDSKLMIFEVDCISFRDHSNEKSRLEKIYKNHDFWRAEPASDIIENKGYVYSKSIRKCLNVDKKPKKKDLIKQKNLEIFEDILNVCLDNSCDVLVIELPSLTSWSEARSVQVKEICDKYNINFIDFNKYEGKEQVVEIDYDKDFRDGGNHLNITGAKKITSYLSNYIVNNYDLTPNKINTKSFDLAYKRIERKL